MNYNTNKIGLHIRLEQCLLQVIKQARDFNVSSFQFFLTSPELKGKYINPCTATQKEFLDLKNLHFETAYIHSSYWINPATNKRTSALISKKMLYRELELAEKLEIPAIIVHPGSAVSDPGTLLTDWKQRGIENAAHMLNNILKDNAKVKILLENTAHGNKAIGSDLNDFITLKSLLHEPEKVGFCLDFAHAFSYGYNLEDIEGFITLVDETMGIKNIDLIHLNDSKECLNSKRDQPAIPGNGHIGKNILQAFINHERLRNIPKILELPIISAEEIQATLKELHTW